MTHIRWHQMEARRNVSTSLSSGRGTTTTITTIARTTTTTTTEALSRMEKRSLLQQEAEKRNNATLSQPQRKEDQKRNYATLSSQPQSTKVLNRMEKRLLLQREGQRRAESISEERPSSYYDGDEPHADRRWREKVKKSRYCCPDSTKVSVRSNHEESLTPGVCGKEQLHGQTRESVVQHRNNLSFSSSSVTVNLNSSDPPQSNNMEEASPPPCSLVDGFPVNEVAPWKTTSCQRWDGGGGMPSSSAGLPPPPPTPPPPAGAARRARRRDRMVATAVGQELFFGEVNLDDLSTLTSSSSSGYRCAVRGHGLAGRRPNSLPFYSSSELPSSPSSATGRTTKSSFPENRHPRHHLDGIDVLSLGSIPSHFPNWYERAMQNAQSNAEKLILRTIKAFDDDQCCRTQQHSVTTTTQHRADHHQSRVRQSLLQHGEFNVWSNLERMSTMVMEGIPTSVVNKTVVEDNDDDEDVNDGAWANRPRRWAVDVPRIFIPSTTSSSCRRLKKSGGTTYSSSSSSSKTGSQRGDVPSSCREHRTRREGEGSGGGDVVLGTTTASGSDCNNDCDASCAAATTTSPQQEQCRETTLVQMRQRRERHLYQLAMQQYSVGELLQQRRFEDAVITMQDMLKYHRSALRNGISDTTTIENITVPFNPNVDKPENDRQTCASAASFDNNDVNDTIVASILHNIGNVYMYDCRYDDARRYYAEALRTRKKALGSANPDVVVTLNKLGMAHYALGDFHASKCKFIDAYTIRRTLLDREHIELGKICNNVGCTHYELGEYNDALKWFHRALDANGGKLMEIRPSCFGNMYGLNVAMTLSNISVVYAQRLDFAECLMTIEEAFSLQSIVLPGNHETNLTYLESLAFALSNSGIHKTAARVYAILLEMIRTKFGLDHTSTMKAMAQLSHSYMKAGLFGSAIDCLKNLTENQSKRLDANDPKLWMSRKSLDMLERTTCLRYGGRSGRCLNPRMSKTTFSQSLKNFIDSTA